MEVAKLFAHIGLKMIDEVAGERHGRTYTDYKAGAVSLPVSETQVQMLLARFYLATRLNCLARCLPSVISQPALRIVDDLLVATVAGCAGENSLADLTAATQGRAHLEMRFGCVLPGAVTSISVLLRRSSAASTKDEQRWSDRALNQAHFGRCVGAFRRWRPMPY